MELLGIDPMMRLEPTAVSIFRTPLESSTLTEHSPALQAVLKMQEARNWNAHARRIDAGGNAHGLLTVGTLADDGTHD